MSVEVQWDGDIHHLPKSYVLDVRNIIDKPEIVGVRFGITGKGIQPNYQIVYIDGSLQTMSGQNHRQFKNVDEFKQGNISPLYTLGELQAVLLGG
ncbi:MAG: hypothetical protein ABN478_13700 [Mixta sp.]